MKGPVSALGINLLGNNVEAAQTVIWTHPKKTEDIGYNFTTTKTITREELNKISKYIDDKDTSANVLAGIATTILTTPLKPYLSISSGIGVTLLTSYRSTNGKLVSDKLKKSTAKSFKVKIAYKYRQTGSNDGYYFIDTIKIS
ncbi:hypothetical protein [Peribacillus sp. NPDC096540]|uniref:hypothetical protein n=1 Tax=Peribacillus sp. NPDC096540 TaxID=3390612 RepID=UPI003D02AA77